MDDKKKILKMFPGMQGWVKKMLDIKMDGVKDKAFGNGVYFTTDPVKMLGCGATVHSSYSPDEPFYPYLPSFIFQPYVGMIYKTTGNTVKFGRNGVTLECPEYAVRAFVLISPEGVKTMPSYGFTDEALGFDHELDTIVIKSPTNAPEIHLDDVQLYGDGNGAHIAVYGHRIYSKDNECFKTWSGARTYGDYDV